MKDFLLAGALLLLATAPLRAQSRVSLAPSYWFSDNPYTYQINRTLNGTATRTLVSGHAIVSSFGLTIHYQFTPQWAISAGALYEQHTDHIKSPQGPYGAAAPFTSEGWQLPLLVNYRLTTHRLAPYLSTGIVLAKSGTFTARPLTTDGVVGAGLIYRINPGLSVLLQPTASYAFYRPAGEADYTFTGYNAYGIGLQTQLLWRL